MQDDIGLPKPTASPPEPRTRRAILGLLALLPAAPLLAACGNGVQPGSGAEAIRRSREQSPPSGR